jgi:hypothetical protein
MREGRLPKNGAVAISPQGGLRAQPNCDAASPDRTSVRDLAPLRAQDRTLLAGDNVALAAGVLSLKK